MESIYNSGCNHNWEFQGVYHENFAQWHCKNCSIVHAQNLAEMMNELQRARQYKIDRSAYVPGHWQCPLCHFYNVVTILNVNTGQYGMAKEHDDLFCPNDGHPMERVTWMQACESTEQTLKSEITRLAAERDTLRAENATLRAELAERNFIGAAIERNKMQPLERRGKDGRMSEIKNNEQLLVHLIVQHCDTHRLVCSSALTELQITEARKNNLFWVDEQSAIGFALVPWEFWTHKDLERASLKWAEAKP